MKNTITVCAVKIYIVVHTHLRRELSCKFFECSKLISQVNARRIEDDRKDGLGGTRVVNHLVSKKYVREEINWPAVSVLRLPLEEKDQPIDRSVVTNNLWSLNPLWFFFPIKSPPPVVVWATYERCCRFSLSSTYSSSTWQPFTPISSINSVKTPCKVYKS